MARPGLGRIKVSTGYQHQYEVAAQLSARFHVPDRSPINDAYIAAIAQRYGCQLVTRNVRDFERLALPLINPFA